MTVSPEMQEFLEDTSRTAHQKTMLAFITQLESVIIDNENKKPITDYKTFLGLVANHVALYFMKRPEFMYILFEQMHVLEQSDWADEALDLLEMVYNCG